MSVKEFVDRLEHCIEEGKMYFSEKLHSLEDAPVRHLILAFVLKLFYKTASST